MKKLFSLFALAVVCLISEPVYAQQPSLNAANTNPVAGERFTYRIATTNPVPGNTGANRTWSFGNLAASGSVTVDYINKTAAPGNNQFGTANIASNTNNTLYQFLLANNTTLQLLGDNLPQQSVLVKYTNAKDLLRYPVNYGNTYTDTYAGSFSVGSITYTRTGRLQVLVDGYGTLVTPSGTYPGVIRINSYDNYRDSTQMGPVKVVNAFTIITHEWYKPGTHAPLMRIIETRTQSATTKQTMYLDQTSVGLKDVVSEISGLQIHPNPATTDAVIRYTIKNRAAVRVSVQNLIGQEMKVVKARNEDAGLYEEKLPLADLPKGIYLVKVQAGDAVTMQRLVVQ